MDDNAGSVEAPQSVAEVEQLVKRLYLPGTPRVITQINDQLQKLQHSSEGWQLADALFGSDDANVRFFAALTFTVKLNSDGSALDSETALTVLSRLIYWLVRLVGHGERPLVCRKLCSTLTTYFIRSPVLWKRPILHLAMSLRGGDAIPSGSLDLATDLNEQIAGLGVGQMTALLWFSATMADEIGRMESHSPAHAQMHNQMEIIVKDASAMMGLAFSQSSEEQSAALKAEALKCFLTWVNYAQPMWPRKPDTLQNLRDLVNAAVQCLGEPSIQRDALDAFRDILESYTSFFQPQDMELLSQIIAVHIQPQLLNALAEKDPDSLPYGQMIIAYGDANIQQVVEQPDNEYGSQTIIKLHFDILRAPGYPGDEDELSIQSIEFWNTYVVPPVNVFVAMPADSVVRTFRYIEYVNDMVYSKEVGEPDPAWLGHAKQVLTDAIKLLWSKMWAPPNDVAKEWSDSESEGFKEFRLDTNDLLLSIYLCLGTDMLRQLVTLTMQSLEAKQWRGVEASLFCLSSLADNVLENQTSERILATVFGSSIFRDVGDFSQAIPSQARRTAIDMLGAYGQYIERHSEYLPDAVRFLFSSLETGLLAGTAAKSIASLCSTCRTSLTGELDGFLQQYQRFLSGPTSDPYTKEKVIGAIASIIQALSPESAKAPPLLSLLENVEKDVQVAKEVFAAGEIEAAEAIGVAALDCLASIGKGLQVPDDMPINLYDEAEQERGQPSFWESADGQAVQQRIMGCFSVLQVLGNVGEAVEAACQVLKSGFAESEPGPFVLPPSVTVSFLQQCTLNTPRLESVLGTACTLIAQHSRSDSNRIDTEVGAICQQVASFIQQLGQPGQDPGVSQSCIDALCRCTPYYVHILLDETSPLASQLPTILAFTLQAIEGPDPFPKRSAQEFWTKLIKPPAAPVSENVRSLLGQVVSAYGLQLTQTLVRQIGGLGQRSELDYLCEPLKALVTNQSATRTWLEAALFSDAFPATSPSVGDAEKRRFVQQVIGLRGDSRKTKEVVKEFYAACRGTVLSYSS